MYGYGQLDHFEYMAMELLDLSVAERQKKNGLATGNVDDRHPNRGSSDLALRDDLESLAYISLFLLRGNLPWKPRPREESQLRSQELVRQMKLSCSGKDLSESFPVEFGNLLDDSRSLDFNQLPDYGMFRCLFANLDEGMSESSDGRLDWTPCYPQTSKCLLDKPKVEISCEDEDDDDDGLG
ncbi:hypothetical protein DFS33DRAFT_1272338 [Desarmillaria ectypa]|nr:hypothetical protein DFS33DRAFT_1272338 [Desarmillaria ectypa]